MACFGQSHTYHIEFLQDNPIILLTVHVAPALLIEMCVECPEHWNLSLIRNSHVIFHCVQGSQHQIEYTHCIPKI